MKKLTVLFVLALVAIIATGCASVPPPESEPIASNLFVLRGQTASKMDATMGRLRDDTIRYSVMAKKRGREDLVNRSLGVYRSLIDQQKRLRRTGEWHFEEFGLVSVNFAEIELGLGVETTSTIVAADAAAEIIGL